MCKCSPAGGRAAASAFCQRLPAQGGARAQANPCNRSWETPILQSRVTLVMNQSLKSLKKHPWQGHEQKKMDFPPALAGDFLKDLKLSFGDNSPSPADAFIDTHTGLFHHSPRAPGAPQTAFPPFLGSLSSPQGSARHPLPAQSNSSFLSCNSKSPSCNHPSINPQSEEVLPVPCIHRQREALPLKSQQSVDDFSFGFFFCGVEGKHFHAPLPMPSGRREESVMCSQSWRIVAFKEQG